ncbi:MAG: flagellar biosynthesis protein FlhB [Acetobacteraceae bacterium]
MAEGGSDQDDKTEAATPKRLQRARDEGQAPISREMALFAGLAGVTLAVIMLGPSLMRDTAWRLSVFLRRADATDLAGAEGIRLAARAAVHGAMPFVLAALVCGVAAVLLQSGFLVTAKPLQPKPERLNPLAGLRRLFSADSLMEAGKSIAKIAVIGIVVWRVLAADLPLLLGMPFQGPLAILSQLGPMLAHVLLAVLAVHGVIAAADLFWVRFRHASKMRMSRQDLRDEQKETEGDPHIKGRIRQLRLQRSRKRMLAAVPKATVVVTNPTHYAVALSYDRQTSAAPTVVAKGIDDVAARIRNIAQENGVPLVANPPLARALYQVKLDTEIPAEHYQAVAEIIAYVWKLGQRSGGAS